MMTIFYIELNKESKINKFILKLDNIESNYRDKIRTIVKNFFINIYNEDVEIKEIIIIENLYTIPKNNLIDALSNIMVYSYIIKNWVMRNMYDLPMFNVLNVLNLSKVLQFIFLGNRYSDKNEINNDISNLKNYYYIDNNNYAVGKESLDNILDLNITNPNMFFVIVIDGNENFNYINKIINISLNIKIKYDIIIKTDNNEYLKVENDNGGKKYIRMENLWI